MGDVSAAYGGKRSPNSVGIRIEELATRQHGVISRSQLLAVGLSPNGITRRHARRDLVRMHQGVYAVGHRRLTSEARELAAVLACGPGAVLSHRTAASRHGLLRSASARIEVSVPRGRLSRKGIVVHRPRVLEDEDREIVVGIPTTSVARTIVDLSSDPKIGRLLDAAEKNRTLNVAAIERTLERLPRQAGRRRLVRLLATYRPEPAFTRSEAERRFLALCRRHGLPTPQANAWIEGYEIDFFWADAALAVEMDGRAFHRGTRAFHEDRRRDRACSRRGSGRRG